jgi:hypothetical protein
MGKQSPRMRFLGLAGSIASLAARLDPLTYRTLMAEGRFLCGFCAAGLEMRKPAIDSATGAVHSCRKQQKGGI